MISAVRWLHHHHRVCARPVETAVEVVELVESVDVDVDVDVEVRFQESDDLVQ